MSTNRRRFPVRPELVFDILSQPEAYQYAVVGTRRVRRFDARWPDAGTKLHHSIGIAPLVIRDSTESLECEPPHRLVLRANFRPLGVALIELRLEGDDGSTLVTMVETPQSGPVSSPRLRTAAEASLWLRNAEFMRRLGKLIARRTQPAETISA